MSRSSSKRALGEETFQREIILGMVDGRVPENLLWNIERIVTNIFIPILNSSAPGRSEDLQNKVKNELLPCLRSFTSSLRYVLMTFIIGMYAVFILRVAEIVWMEGVFLKDYPPEAFTIRCLEDSQAFLQTEGGYQRFEEYLKTWMKKIQELLFDSEQLRRETDNLGPQVKQNENIELILLRKKDPKMCLFFRKS